MKKINYFILVIICLFVVVIQANAQTITVGGNYEIIDMEPFDIYKIAGYHDDNIRAYCKSLTNNAEAMPVKNADGTYVCKVKATGSGTISIDYGIVDVNGYEITANKGVSLVASKSPSSSSGSGSSSSPASSGEKVDQITKDDLSICDPNNNKGALAALRLVGIFVTILKIIVPIILIVLGMIDVGRAVIDSKPEAITKSLITFAKRAAAAVLVFFVPLIVEAIFTYVDGWDDLRSEYTDCVECALGTDKCPKIEFKK